MNKKKKGKSKGGGGKGKSSGGASGKGFGAAPAVAALQNLVNPTFQYAGTVVPGVQSPQRVVTEPNIMKPDYADDGMPKNRPQMLPWVIEQKTPEEILKMRAAGRVAREVLDIAGRMVKPGVTTDEIDAVVHEETLKRGAYPSPLNYHGFPKSCCTSVNEGEGTVNTLLLAHKLISIVDIFLSPHTCNSSLTNHLPCKMWFSNIQSSAMESPTIENWKTVISSTLTLRATSTDITEIVPKCLWPAKPMRLAESSSRPRTIAGSSR